MLFKTVIGHQLIKEKLIGSIQQGRIGHAQLFLGAEGSGNLAMALAYLQYLFCHNPQEKDACGVCPSCLKAEKLVHPDIHFSFPFFAKNNKDFANNYVDTFREAVLNDPYLSAFSWFTTLGSESKQGLINVMESSEISRKLQLKSYEGGFKAALIWLPEYLNIQAANKLLKLLEEPPDHTVILLVTSKHEQLIPTLRSRTQLVKLPRLTNLEIKNGLIRKFEMEHELAENLAAISDGNFFIAQEQAKNLSDQNENFLLFREWMRFCFKKDIKGVSQWVQKIGAMGRERQKHFLAYALHLTRQCALLNYDSESLVTMGGEERVFMYKFAPFVTHINLQQYVENYNLAILHIERNANPRILFTDLSFQILVLLNQKG